MIYLFAILLLLVLIVWGIAQGAQNIAMAKQAEATIETARAAQAASFGNVIALLIVLVIVLLLAVALIYGMIYLSRHRKVSRATYTPRMTQVQKPELPKAPDLDQLIKVLTLQALMKMSSMDKHLEDHDLED